MSPPTPDLRGKSLLLFDDGLASLDGHWFEYDRQVVQFHRARGAAVVARLLCSIVRLRPSVTVVNW